MPQTRWATFGPDPSPSSLPESFLQCLYPASPSATCDNLIGDADSGHGFCSLPEYRTTTYCACVNNSAPCPQISMASCANAAFSYKPAAWYTPTGPNGSGPSKNADCATSPICINLVEVGGDQNVVSGITQQCGTITNVTNVLKTNPFLAVLTFLLVIVLIIVMTSHTESAEGSLPLPDMPPPLDFSI